MGTLTNGSGWAAHTGKVFSKGLNLRMSKFNNDDGTYEALSTATFRMGQFVAYDANGKVIPSTGSDTFGVAKWDKVTTGVSINFDEVLTMTGTTAQNLKRANVSNVSVRSAVNFGGTLYTVTTDYTVNAANGTVTRVALGAIADGGTVYVTYTFALVDADYDFDGRSFRNQSADRVTGQENRIAVITDWSRLFSMEWDTLRNYAFTGATAHLYVSAEGKATSTSGTDEVGKVAQLPTATDKYMGMHLAGNPI